MFSRSLLSLVVLTRGMHFLWICQAKTIWAGDLPCASEISLMTGSASTFTSLCLSSRKVQCPEPIDAYGSRCMPYFWWNSLTLVYWKYGCTSIWFRTGLILHPARRSKSIGIVQLLTPILLVSPFSTRASIPAQTMWCGGDRIFQFGSSQSTSALIQWTK